MALIEPHLRSFDRVSRRLSAGGHALACAGNAPRRRAGTAWWDALERGDGRIALISAWDHGRDAAASAILGSALRAASATAAKPADALRAVGADAASSINEWDIIVAFLEPAAARMTYATAGKAALVLAAADGLTAMFREAVSPAPGQAISLPPRTVAILSTRPTVVEGLISIDAQAAPGATAAAVAGRLAQVRETLGASLVLALSAGAADSFVCALPAVPISAPLVRASLRSFARDAGLDADQTFALQTAVGEAVANAIEHAYHHHTQRGVVRVSVERGDGVLTVWVEDDGSWRPDRERCEQRGRGLPLMRALVDGLEVRSSGSSTAVRLTLRFA